MPELYGNPFKWEIRSELAETRRELWNEQKEHRMTRRRLKYVEAENEELKSQLQKIGELGTAILNESNRDTKDAVGDRFLQKILPRHRVAAGE